MSVGSEFSPTRNGYSHAALMGDIVGSGSAGSPRALYDVFNDVIRCANERHGQVLASPLTITLGDEFQGLCYKVEDAVDLMRRIRRELADRHVDCRFVVGPVRMDTPVNTEVAWNMMGFGLAFTRDKLADKRSANGYRFALPDHPVLTQVLDEIGHDLTAIEKNWTPRQREIAQALSAESVAELASRLNTSVQTIYKIRRAGEFDSYERKWRVIGESARQLDLAFGLS